MLLPAVPASPQTYRVSKSQQRQASAHGKAAAPHTPSWATSIAE